MPVGEVVQHQRWVRVVLADETVDRPAVAVDLFVAEAPACVSNI